jgi:hypothetical protein
LQLDEVVVASVHSPVYGDSAQELECLLYKNPEHCKSYVVEHSRWQTDRVVWPIETVHWTNCAGIEQRPISVNNS